MLTRSAARKRPAAVDLSASQVVAALREMYPTRAYAFFEQVANGTGWAGRRYGDAMALSLWPSRGLDLYGFEVKVSRSDWKREVDDPAKADDIARYCDFWFIATPAGLIDVTELPPTWGLIEVDASKKAGIVQQATRLDAKVLDRAFVAALLRRQSESLDGLLREARNEGRNEGAANGSPDISLRLERAESQLNDLREIVATFDKASGLTLSRGWPEVSSVGKAVKLLLDGEYRADHAVRLKTEAEMLRSTAAKLEKEAAMIQKIRGTDDGAVEASP
jgi:hypothetical protein